MAQVRSPGSGAEAPQLQLGARVLFLESGWAMS